MAVRRFSITLLTALVVASCSSNDASTRGTEAAAASTTSTSVAATSTTVEATTTTEAATTTTLSELEQAQVAYFYASAEINGTQTKEWDKACGASGPNCKTVPWSAWKQYCIAMAPVIEKFAAAVSAYEWPENAKDEAQALVARNAAEAQIYYRCKDASSNRELRDIDQALQDLGPYGEAAAFRIALGLPINQG